MELILDFKRPILKVGSKQLSGTDNDVPSHYFSCKYVFEPSWDECNFKDISELAGNDFPNNVCTNLHYKSDSYEHVFATIIGRKNNRIEVSLTGSYTTGHWDEKMNLKHFLARFNTELNTGDAYEVDFINEAEHDNYFVTLNFTLALDSPLKNALSEASAYLENTHKIVLDSFSQDDGFISQFRFPNEYKAAFIQYLTYFGKFLEDLGIRGDISIRERDDLTYLSFLPECGEVALSNIAAALTSYLSLPNGDSSVLVCPNAEIESEVRFQQLASVIDHLKSQLRLANAMIALKEREITLLDNRLYLKRNDSNWETPDVRDYWEPIRGIRITTYKGKFFEINIPTLIGSIYRSKKDRK